MELCSDKHDEICYTNNYCPACELLETISKLEDTIYTLNEEIKGLNQEEI